MDKCQEWELNDLMENIPYLDRNLWESQRLNTYVVAQVNSRKKMELKDICNFKWEQEVNKTEEEYDVEINNDEIRRLKEIAKQWENK